MIPSQVKPRKKPKPKPTKLYDNSNVWIDADDAFSVGTEIFANDADDFGILDEGTYTLEVGVNFSVEHQTIEGNVKSFISQVD